MKLKKFISNIDKVKFKKVLKLSFCVIAVLLIINIIGVTNSRYSSSATMNAEANIAYFIVEQGTYENSISISGLTPRTDPYLYKINVYNYKGTQRSNVDLTYTIKFETTTNLPLTYEVIKNEEYSVTATNIITNTSFRQDGDMYYQVLETNVNGEFSYTANEMDQYTIIIHFPISYKNEPNKYQGKIDLISVIIDTEQVV